jgi:hypothetical protein
MTAGQWTPSIAIFRRAREDQQGREDGRSATTQLDESWSPTGLSNRRLSIDQLPTSDYSSGPWQASVTFKVAR